MLKLSFALALVACGLAPLPALATDYSHVQCDSPKFVSYMNARFGRMHPVARGNSTQPFATAQIESASTISATTDRIVCQVTVSMGARTQHGRFIVEQAPSSTQTSWHWQPGY